MERELRRVYSREKMTISVNVLFLHIFSPDQKNNWLKAFLWKHDCKMINELLKEQCRFLKWRWTDLCQKRKVADYDETGMHNQKRKVWWRSKTYKDKARVGEIKGWRERNVKVSHFNWYMTIQEYPNKILNLEDQKVKGREEVESFGFCQV